MQETLLEVTGNDHARVRDGVGRVLGYRAVIERGPFEHRFSRRRFAKASMAKDYKRALLKRLSAIFGWQAEGEMEAVYE